MPFGSGLYMYLNTLCHRVSEFIWLFGCHSTSKEGVACFFCYSGERRPLEVMPFVDTYPIDSFFGILIEIKASV